MPESYADPFLLQDIQSALDGLDDWTPEKKIFCFIEGMACNAADLVSFRNDPTTRDFVGRHEEALWRVKNAIELVLSSIAIERDAVKQPQLKLVQ